MDGYNTLVKLFWRSQYKGSPLCQYHQSPDLMACFRIIVLLNVNNTTFLDVRVAIKFTDTMNNLLLVSSLCAALHYLYYHQIWGHIANVQNYPDTTIWGSLEDLGNMYLYENEVTRPNCKLFWIFRRRKRTDLFN